MDGSIIIIALMTIGVIVFISFSNKKAGGRNVCTRCRGSGEVNERWPDPNKPGGWHILEDKCPKCKGKGRTN